MNDCRFILGGASLATLALCSVTFAQECNTTPPSGAILQNDDGICALGEGGSATDPNAGCLVDWSAVQDAGILTESGLSISGIVGTGLDVGDEDWYAITADTGGFITFDIQQNNVTAGDIPDTGYYFGVYQALTPGDCAGGLDNGAFGGGVYYVPACGTYVFGDNVSVGAGTYLIRTGSTSGPGGEPANDCTTSYLITVTWNALNDACGDPASGSCIEANGTPGCADAACCDIVCEADSICCDSGWDEACATNAVDLCGYFVYECNSTGASPANDCAADAQTVALSEAGIEVAFDTTNAETDGPPQPECGSAPQYSQLDKDVWFLVTPAVDGFVNAVTCGYNDDSVPANWDTKIAAYGPYASFPGDFDGDQLEAAFILCNEDGCDDGTYTSDLSFEVTGGNSYLVRIGGWNGENGTGTCYFSIIEGACGPDSAVVVGDNIVNNTAAIVGALEFGDTTCDLNDGTTAIGNPVFYSFSVTEEDVYSFETCGQPGTAAFDTSLAILSGLTCDASAVVGCNGDACAQEDGNPWASQISELTLAVGDYTVVVGGWNGSQGETTLVISKGSGPDPCEGYTNTCDIPEEIGAVGTYGVTVADGCSDPVDYAGSCDFGDFGDEAVYNPYFIRFTAPADAGYTFSLCGSLLDTRIALQGNCDPVTVLACNDDFCGLQSETNWNMTAGETLIIAIGGYSAGDFGDATLTITDDLGPDPCEGYTNDCTSPEEIFGFGDYAFDTTCAFDLGGRDWDATPCDFGFDSSIAYNTYYFAFEATADGAHTFSTCGQAAFDTRIFVATSCDAGSTIGCNDDGTDPEGNPCSGFTSSLEVELTAGLSYIVGVGGYGTADAGTGLLTVTGPEEPECPADLNGDGIVNGADLTILLGDWGGSAADLNGDGTVDGADLTVLLGSWGDC